MNAFGNPTGASGGVQREQTMEEILASIRKIIESNEAISNANSADLHTTYEQKFGADIIEATPNSAPLVQPALTEARIEPENYVGVPVQAPISTLQDEMARLVSQSPERRVAAAFDDLNTAFVKAKHLPVENVAEAMLRPMLKDWLDNNLPNLVERLVREEISRIARGDI